MKKIKSAEFIKGIVGPDKVLQDTRKKIAFIGRSNVGKSSIINFITEQKKLAKISSTPGRTREVNLFLINESFYLIDLPGYGYAKLPETMRMEIRELINWFLFTTDFQLDKIFLIIDAKVGPTKDDLEILEALESYKKNVFIIVNKIDKLKSSQKGNQVSKIKEMVGDHPIILCSAKNNIGIDELFNKILD